MSKKTFSISQNRLGTLNPDFKIKAIIFDVGGVLELGKYSPLKFVRHRTTSVHKFMAKSFRITLDQWFDSIDTAYAESIEGKISKKKALSIIAKDVETTPKHLENLFIQAYKKYFKRNNELYNFAFALKKAGYKIAILSDQWYVSEEAVIRKEDTQKFNVVVVSCDVGMRKPNPKIYKLTLSKLKTKAKNSVFIDNQKWNISAANKLGMKTVLYKSNWQAIRDLRKLGVKLK